jgi:hypothetical protein
LFIREGFKGATDHHKGKTNQIRPQKKRENGIESEKEKITINTRDNHCPSLLFIIPLYQWRQYNLYR